MSYLPASLPSEIASLAENDSNNLITVIFTDSTSKNFSVALSVAKRATFFTSIKEGKTTYYYSAFGKDAAQCNFALSLIDIASKWATTIILVNDRLAFDIPRVKETLNCISRASRCIDKRAHCHSIVYALGCKSEQESLYRFNNKNVSRWLHPCTRLSTQGLVNQLDKSLPSNLQNQLQAQAVRMECEWCPYFSQSDLTQLKP